MYVEFQRLLPACDVILGDSTLDFPWAAKRSHNGGNRYILYLTCASQLIWSNRVFAILWTVNWI